MKIVILPELALRVMWTPAPDASHSSLTYVINVTVESGGTAKLLSTYVPHPISMKTFTGLSSYSVGSVLLQATNPGAMSKAVTVSFRMVNLTGEGVLAIRPDAHESSLHACSCTVLQLILFVVQSLNCSIAVSDLTAEWINRTTLRVMWEPVQVTDGVSVAYIINYSPILEISNALQNVSEVNVTEFQMFKATKRAIVTMDNLHPSLFYHVRVMVHLNQFQDPCVTIGELW